jgi:hypothetical protein
VIPDPLEHLWARTQPRVTRAIRNAHTWLDGHPTGTGSGSGGTGDRTGTLAARHATHGDPHGDLRRDLERTISRLADLVDRLAPTNRAAAHLATQADDTCPTDCCESCFRDGGHRTPKRNDGGRLCRWCQDIARTIGADQPPLALVEKHHRGRRITERDINIARRA